MEGVSDFPFSVLTETVVEAMGTSDSSSDDDDKIIRLDIPTQYKGTDKVIVRHHFFPSKRYEGLLQRFGGPARR